MPQIESPAANSAAANTDASLGIPAATRQRPVWLRVGMLLDGVSTTPLKNAHIVYDDRRILFAGTEAPARDLVPAGRSAPDLDLPEFTLLPGLIEAHAHFFLEGGELDLEKRSAYLERSPEQLLRLAIPRLEKLARLGIVGVRDAGDRHGVGLALSKLYASAGRPLMPYVDSPGAAIHHRGRYGGFMAEPMEDFPSPAACVVARVEAGAYRIKLIPTGIINFKKGAVTAAPQMTAEEIRALVVTAQSLVRQTLAHASGDEGIERALDGGVDTIEHGFFVRSDQLAKMRDRGIAWVPTFAPVQKQVDHAGRMGWDSETVSNLRRILDAHAASLVKAHAMGVTIIAGSDAGSVGVAHGLDFFYELELMERAGLSPLAVLNSATGAGSRRLAFGEKFARIERGFSSRFLLTCHSPLESVANLRKPKSVIFNGVLLESRATLDPSGL
ncbi:MAG TPA: amidohydrolase family protein [Terracidiphilus sp.]|nr:amidohydrolase family protein [Terracidiphilus sp.]